MHADVLGFPDGSVVKNSPAMQETLVRFLSCEDLQEKGMATHASILFALAPSLHSFWSYFSIYLQ